MERVSDEWIDDCIKALEEIAKSEMRGPYEQLLALTELRERRAAENYIPHPACPCANKTT